MLKQDIYFLNSHPLSLVLSNLAKCSTKWIICQHEFLLRDTMLVWMMLSCVCVSITLRYCIKMAKHRMRRCFSDVKDINEI